LTLASTLELDERGSEALAQSAWWRGKRSPSPLWRRRWSKVAWLRHLSGVTCEPSTLARGVASWIASLAATHVSRSVSPAIAVAKTIPVIYGQMSLAFFESASPPGVSSRTSPAICLSEDTMSSESFRRWASALRAHCGRRRKSARPIGESDCSSWEFGTLLPTPTASDYGSHRGIGQRARPSLDTMARRGVWPTPSLSDTRGASSFYTKSQSGRSLGTIARVGMLSMEPGQLNPTWVEWLMGWPLGWSDCACSETASSQSKPLKHS